MAVAGRPVVLTTTNGTRTLRRIGEAAQVLAGCLRNAASVARACDREGRDVVIACAGTHDRFSIEDALGAGLVVRHLVELGEAEIREAAAVCMRVADSGDDPEGVLRSGRHGQHLLTLGFEADLRFCAEVDASQRVPVLANGWLI